MDWDAYKAKVEGSRRVIVFPFFVEQLKGVNGVGVDVGCGHGDLTHLVAQVSGSSVVGIDSDEERLALARINHPDTHFVRGEVDKNSIPTIGLTFDFAFSSCCFCHLNDDGIYNTLFDLHNCMNVGARMVILVPSIHWAKEMYAEIRFETSGLSAIPRFGGRQYFRTNDWYRAALTRCGFNIIESKEIQIPEDDRLEDRYRHKVGSNLFSAFIAERVELLPDSESMKKAFEVAHDNRKLEINLFWQRSLFFWGFVSAALIAYGAAYSAKSGLEFVFALFGLVCGVVWSSGNRGSKYWQEYWEGKVNLLQHYVTGNIFYDRSPKEPGFFDFFEPRRTSVSKLTMALSDYAVLLWLSLCVISTYRAAERSMALSLAVGSAVIATQVYCLWIIRKSKSED